jgi:hypothetical protein
MKTKKILMFGMFLFYIPIAGAQIVAPFTQNKAIKKELREADSLRRQNESVKTNSLVVSAVRSRPNFGWMPLRNKGGLRQLYDQGALTPAQAISFSTILRDSANAPTSYVEVLSFIPNTSELKVALGLQLTAAEASDTTQTPEDIALQKLMNKGGNISLSFSRPFYYVEKDERFFIVDVETAFFLDVTNVNRQIYNPGAGAQLNIRADLRLMTKETENKRQAGDLFRLGIRGGFTQNLFNSRYAEENDIIKEFNSVSYGTVEVYVGLFFLDLRYSYVISGNEIFDDRRNVVSLGIVPIKF